MAVPVLDDLVAVLADRTDPRAFPHADTVELAQRREQAPALFRALADGPGVVVVRGALDRAVVDRVTAEFDAMIAEQYAAGQAVGDHFAAVDTNGRGTNDRVWNALEKLAVRAPAAFVDYYASDVLARVALAWLGPGYQVTSQVNVVHPGGAAQVGHRDYHLGFLPPTEIVHYPAHVHRLSPVLTLQGAVAHADMPVESGPTLYLPHSQKYADGYLATALPEFAAHFARHHVQLPLAVGDAAFFNPAVIHGAGHNRSADVRRTANLLQISSAFGRAMESVDRARVCRAVYPYLTPDTDHAVSAAAEGYAFPTNLDRDPPVDGLAPPTQADLVRRAVAQGWTAAAFDAALTDHARRRESH